LSLALLGVTLGAISGWATIDLIMLFAGVACLVAFVPIERVVPSPMMDLALFRNRAFSAGVVSNLLASTARGAVGLVLVFYFQGALGLDALTAGVLLIPFSLAFVSIGPVSGYLSDKYGPRGFTTAGLHCRIPREPRAGVCDHGVAHAAGRDASDLRRASRASGAARSRGVHGCVPPDLLRDRGDQPGRGDFGFHPAPDARGRGGHRVKA